LTFLDLEQIHLSEYQTVGPYSDRILFYPDNTIHLKTFKKYKKHEQIIELNIHNLSTHQILLKYSYADKKIQNNCFLLNLFFNAQHNRDTDILRITLFKYFYKPENTITLNGLKHTAM
jgi:hypothetical protein